MHRYAGFQRTPLLIRCNDNPVRWGTLLQAARYEHKFLLLDGMLLVCGGGVTQTVDRVPTVEPYSYPHVHHFIHTGHVRCTTLCPGRLR